MRIGQDQGFVPDPIVMAMEQQANSVALEIDVDAFEQENQARMLRGDQGYRPNSAVEFQFGGYIFSVGFIHQCSKCKHSGPRKEFNDFEMPPWKCPKCKSAAVYQMLPLKSERHVWPEAIANHGYRTMRVYPNKITQDGQMLVEKDNSQPSIPLLRRVSQISGLGEERKSTVQRGFQCQFCPEEFLTLKLLADHRVAAHGLGGGAIAAPVVAPPAGVPAARAAGSLRGVPAAAVEQQAPPPAEEPAEAPEAVAGAEPEANDLTGRSSPAEIKAMIAKAQKARGAKAGGPEAE